MIYLTSDLHFCHNRDFLYAPRGFHDAGEMNHTIVSNWNHVVKDDDEVYVLGDMMLNDDAMGIYLIKQLRGRLHIIRGNHDSDRRLELYEKCFNVLDIQNSAYLHYNSYHFYLSHYPTLTSNFDFDKPLKSRLINLCGHSHTTDPFMDWKAHNAPIYHCELDAHDCKPISIDEALRDICSYNANLKR